MRKAEMTEVFGQCDTAAQITTIQTLLRRDWPNQHDLIEQLGAERFLELAEESISGRTSTSD